MTRRFKKKRKKTHFLNFEKRKTHIPEQWLEGPELQF